MCTDNLLSNIHSDNFVQALKDEYNEIQTWLLWFKNILPKNQIVNITSQLEENWQ